MDVEANLALDHDDAGVGAEDDSWERFMILWGVTPEILVGSCLMSLFVIIATCVVTGRTRPHDSHNQKAILKNLDISSRRNGKTIDVAESSSISRGSVTEDEILTRTSLARHQHHKDAVANMPCKKNLFKFVSDKMQNTLTDEQLNEEKEIKRKQLEAIYNLMKNEGDLFGIHDIYQIEEQMKLYG